MTLRDWSRRGIFLQGSLLTGGPLVSGCASDCGALDLDGDGDADVYVHGSDFERPGAVVPETTPRRRPEKIALVG